MIVDLVKPLPVYHTIAVLASQCENGVVILLSPVHAADDDMPGVLFGRVRFGNCRARANALKVSAVLDKLRHDLLAEDTIRQLDTQRIQFGARDEWVVVSRVVKRAPVGMRFVLPT